MRVGAHDLGDPELESAEQTTLTVRVQRNRNCPSFDADSDDVSIVETLDVGSVIAQVRAQDSDDEVRIQNRKKTF